MKKRLGYLLLLVLTFMVIFNGVTYAGDTPTLKITAPKVVYSPAAVITAKASGPYPLKYLTVNKNNYALPGTKKVVKTVKVSLYKGSNLIVVKVVDRRGKYTVKKFYITYVDRTPPELSVSAPNLVKGSTAEIKIAVKDPSRVVRLEIGSHNLLSTPVYSYQTSIKVTLNPGINTFTIKARDSFGNVSTKTIKISREVTDAAVNLNSGLKFDYSALLAYPEINTYNLALKPGEEIQPVEITGIPSGMSADFGFKPKGIDKIYAIKEFSGSTISGEKLYFRYGSGSYYLLFYRQASMGRVYIEKVVKINVSGITDKGDLLPSGFVDSDNETIRQIAYELTKDLTDDLSRVKAIHDYVAKALTYDWNSYYRGIVPQKKASEALSSGTGVCQDYSRLFAAIARAAGIPTRIVIGTGDGEPHAWNRVYVNGKWLDVDVTWDDQENHGIIYDYFLKEAPLPKHVEDTSAEAYYEAEMLHSITFEE